MLPCAEEVLEYFSVREKEGAARTSHASLLASLRFLEEAGEVAPENRISTSSALDNAVKEHELTAASRPAATAATLANAGSKQAPPQLLAMLAAMEDMVSAPGVPLYHKGYAWFKLLRHWTSMRWDDTQGLRPLSLTV